MLRLILFVTLSEHPLGILDNYLFVYIFICVFCLEVQCFGVRLRPDCIAKILELQSHMFFLNQKVNSYVHFSYFLSIKILIQ